MYCLRNLKLERAREPHPENEAKGEVRWRRRERSASFQSVLTRVIQRCRHTLAVKNQSPLDKPCGFVIVFCKTSLDKLPLSTCPALTDAIPFFHIECMYMVRLRTPSQLSQRCADLLKQSAHTKKSSWPVFVAKHFVQWDVRGISSCLVIRRLNNKTTTKFSFFR